VDFNNIKSMVMLQEKMKHHANKQSVIAENFANAETPGYKKKDMVEPDFNKMVGLYSQKIELTTTNPKHINPNAIGSESKIYSTGNKVKLDMEAIALTQNVGEYNKTASTYRKMISLVKEALGGQGQ